MSKEGDTLTWRTTLLLHQISSLVHDVIVLDYKRFGPWPELSISLILKFLLTTQLINYYFDFPETLIQGRRCTNCGDECLRYR